MSLPQPLLSRAGLIPNAERVGQDLVQRLSNLFGPFSHWEMFGVFSLYAIVISLVATCATVSRPLAGHFKKVLVLFSL